MEKKILGTITVIFFLVMITFTFVSRSVGRGLLPEVEAVYVENGEVLPATAVYTDERGNNSVYILVERESILGTVETAESVPVTIIESEEGKTALAGIAEFSGFPFVKDVSAGIGDGDRVRRADDGEA